MRNIRVNRIQKILLRLSLSVFFLFTSATQALFSQHQNWDIRTLDKINSNASVFGDNAFKFMSHSVTPLYIGTPVLLFSTGVVKKDSAMKVNALRMAATFLINGAATYSLKIAFKRERPYVTYPFLEKKDVGGSHSFPSGHTSAAFSLATSLSLAYPKWYVIAPAFTYAALVGYSRMYLGVHYPSDVLGGMIIGAGVSCLSWKLQKMLIKKRK